MKMVEQEGPPDLSGGPSLLDLARPLEMHVDSVTRRVAAA